MAWGNNRRDNDGLAICDFSEKPVRVGWGICSITTLIVAAVLIGVSLKKLSSVEYGVEYDKWTKTLDEAAKSGGLHAGPPGYTFIKFPSTQIGLDLLDTCVSRDGLRVQFDVTFQYQMPEDRIVDAIEQYRDFKTWSTVVEAAGNSAVQHTCSDFNVTDFQTVRTLIQDAMQTNLRIKLEGSLNGTTDEGVYALASSLQLRNVILPSQYTDAIASKQRAEEDIALAKNQRTQETTKANTEKLAAEEEARKIRDSAYYNTGNVTLIEQADDLKAQVSLVVWICSSIFLRSEFGHPK